MVVLFFTVSSCSETKETFFDCQWQSGKANKRTIVKGEELSKDVIIGLNISKKKVTQIAWGLHAENVSWSDDKIAWTAKNILPEMTSTYSLSRITGALVISIYDNKLNVEIKNDYKCDGTQKKF